MIYAIAHMRKLLPALLLAISITVASLACAAAEPPPTPVPLPTYTPFPTWTPAPTPTAYPTQTPYPTWTPAPTPTAYPTQTPLPTHTPYPTWTPVPTATSTPRPTATPRPTSTPIQARPPETWKSSGDWRRDRLTEQSLTETLKANGFTQIDVRAVTLDATRESSDADLSVSFACIGGERLAYITPYAYEVPEAITSYSFGVWNWMKMEFEDNFFHYDPARTDDNGSIFIPHPGDVQQILDMLRQMRSYSPSHKVVEVSMWRDEEVILIGDLSPAGIEDALEYLGCFE